MQLPPYLKPAAAAAWLLWWGFCSSLVPCTLAPHLIAIAAAIFTVQDINMLHSTIPTLKGTSKRSRGFACLSWPHGKDSYCMYYTLGEEMDRETGQTQDEIWFNNIDGLSTKPFVFYHFDCALVIMQYLYHPSTWNIISPSNKSCIASAIKCAKP